MIASAERIIFCSSLMRSSVLVLADAGLVFFIAP